MELWSDARSPSIRWFKFWQGVLLNRTIRSDTATSVAFVGISSTNAVEFYKIANAFQEIQFKPTTESLLADAVQTTSSSDAQYMDSLIASLSAAFAGAAIDQKSTSSTDAQGVVTTSASRSSERKTPDAPSTMTFTINPPAATDPASQLTGTEAQLKYQVAKSLSEEVAMLNDQVANIAHRSGYRPYLVSIQVTIQPYDRGYPYDTYLDISFSSNNKAYASPTVLPLLISDALENTRQAQASTLVRQLGAQLKSVVAFHIPKRRLGV